MRTEDIILRLFCRVDDKLAPVKKRKHANLYPREIVTIGILFTLKGVHSRAFYRGLKGDWRHLFPHLPECSRRLALVGGVGTVDRPLFGGSAARKGDR
jgi:hypothetical protein